MTSRYGFDHSPLTVSLDYAPSEVTAAFDEYTAALDTYRSTRERWGELARAVEQARETDKQAAREAVAKGEDAPPPTLPDAEAAHADHKRTVVAAAEAAEHKAAVVVQLATRHRWEWSANAHDAAVQQYPQVEEAAARFLEACDALGTARDIQSWAGRTSPLAARQQCGRSLPDSDRKTIEAVVRAMKPEPLAEPPKVTAPEPEPKRGPNVAERTTASAWTSLTAD
jgi:hypothetical protein